jgi:hypothetical protein
MNPEGDRSASATPPHGSGWCRHRTAEAWAAARGSDAASARHRLGIGSASARHRLGIGSASARYLAAPSRLPS